MNLRQLIKEHEGLRLSSYQCSAGDWTVGWGHNLTAHGEPEQAIITMAQAEDFLDQDIQRSIVDCQMLIPVFDLLDEVRQAVLIDMCFNLGAGGLAKFAKFLRHVHFGEWDWAADDMLDSLWATQVKRRANRLARMMRTGEWPEA